jgi:site-specific DNA-methyltransferase (adenine-specific)
MAVNIEDAGFEIRDMLQWVYGTGFPKSMNLGAKNEAFNGWFTGLKPSVEPITLARKPIEGATICYNMAKYGTGGLNIDDCRVEVGQAKKGCKKGRYPANFIHDGSDDVICRFPYTKSGNVAKGGFEGDFNGKIFGKYAKNQINEQNVYADEGSASRFFYCAKPSKKEKGRYNDHLTVKPIRLMNYLIRLVTPNGGIVLDPFCGSGTTAIAALQGNYRYYCIDADAKNIEIAERRLTDYLMNIDF